MKCINCKSELIQQKYEGVVIDKCPSCDGVWLDHGELGKILDARDVKFSRKQIIENIKKKNMDAAVTTSYNCPHCSKKMNRFNYSVNSGVILDRCPDEHGLWFDKGELEKIQIVMEESDKLTGSFDDNLINNDIKICPKCRTQLHEISYEGIPLDTCETCKGYWCDDSELGEIVKRREIAFSKTDSPEITAKAASKKISGQSEVVPEFPCAICGKLMQRFNYQNSSGIIIDSCVKGHGVWLDKGEIEKVQIFFERWNDKNDDEAAEYKKMIRLAKTEQQKRIEDGIKTIRISRFSPVNRFIQMLSRNGFL